MKIIGITGPTGSGKTLAAQAFRKRGALVIDADTVAHDVLLKTGGAYNEVMEAFGAGILGDGGEIDRKALAAAAFADPERLKLLNAVTHKHITAVIMAAIEAAINAETPPSAVVVDAVLLLEAGFGEVCDDVILVSASEEARFARITHRDALPPEAAKRRIAGHAWVKTEDAARFVRHTLVNDGTTKEFIKKTEDLAKDVLGDA